MFRTLKKYNGSRRHSTVPDFLDLESKEGLD
jgi:hypothetical protein